MDGELATSSSTPEQVWRAGRTRRRRRSLAAAASAAVLLLLLTLVLVPVARPELVPAGKDGAAQGYPQRVTGPALGGWPEVVAGVASSADARRGIWLVAPDGSRYDAGENRPARSPVLAPDGSRVAYLLEDLAEGGSGSTTLGLAVAGRAGATSWLPLQGQEAPRWQGHLPGVDLARGAWSPDGRRLALPVSFEGVPDAPSVMVYDGGAPWFMGPNGTRLAGWRADGRLLVWRPGDGPQVPLLALDAANGSTSGRTVDTTEVSAATGGLSDLTVDPAGTTLAAIRSEVGATTLTSLTGHLDPGRRALTLSSTGSLDVRQGGFGCPSWRGNRPLYQLSGEDPAVRLPGSGAAVTVIDPGLGVDCLQLTPAALAGKAHGAWLGTNQSWLAWHWRTVVGWAVGLALVGLLLWSTNRLPRGWSYGMAADGPGAYRARRGSVVTRGRDDDPWDQAGQDRMQGPFGRP